MKDNILGCEKKFMIEFYKNNKNKNFIIDTKRGIVKVLNNKFEIDKLTTNDFFKERYAYLRQHALNNTISETEKIKLMNELNYA